MELPGWARRQVEREESICTLTYIGLGVVFCFVSVFFLGGGETAALFDLEDTTFCFQSELEEPA